MLLMPLPAFSLVRRLGGLLLAAVVLLALAAACWAFWPRAVPAPLPPTTASQALPSAGPPPADGRLRGVSWVGTDSASMLDLAPLTKAGVTWIAQMPFGWQAGAAEPAVQLRTGAGSRRYWGESDAGILLTARQARQRGIRTLLKPHLWLRGPSSWSGDINMGSEADWQTWFRSYSAFMLHYARLAETGKLDALCIGTELERTVGHEAEWRALIKQIRQVYHGPLTYAANWSGEFEQVKFWDALDFIGVQAYFPLSTQASPDKARLLAAWQEPLRRLEAVQKKYNRPVVFTEVGYKATADAAIRPWEWPQKLDVLVPADEATQAACYAALFETFWPRPWFKGLFIWKWYPGLPPDGPAHRHADFTPQHKPAEQVMSMWFLKGG